MLLILLSINVKGDYKLRAATARAVFIASVTTIAAFALATRAITAATAGFVVFYVLCHRLFSVI